MPKRRNWTQSQDDSRREFFRAIIAAGADREQLVQLRGKVQASESLWNEHRKSLIGQIDRSIRAIDVPPTAQGSTQSTPRPWDTDDAAGALAWLAHKDSEGYEDIREELFEVEAAVFICDDEGYPIPPELRERVDRLYEQVSAADAADMEETMADADDAELK